LFLTVNNIDKIKGHPTTCRGGIRGSG